MLDGLVLSVVTWGVWGGEMQGGRAADVSQQADGGCSALPCV